MPKASVIARPILRVPRSSAAIAIDGMALKLGLGIAGNAVIVAVL